MIFKMYIFLIIMISYFQAGLHLVESALIIFLFFGPEDLKLESKPKFQIVNESKLENMKAINMKIEARLNIDELKVNPEIKNAVKDNSQTDILKSRVSWLVMRLRERVRLGVRLRRGRGWLDVSGQLIPYSDSSESLMSSSVSSGLSISSSVSESPLKNASLRGSSSLSVSLMFSFARLDVPVRDLDDELSAGGMFVTMSSCLARIQMMKTMVMFRMIRSKMEMRLGSMYTCQLLSSCWLVECSRTMTIRQINLILLSLVGVGMLRCVGYDGLITTNIDIIGCIRLLGHAWEFGPDIIIGRLVHYGFNVSSELLKIKYRYLYFK